MPIKNNNIASGLSASAAYQVGLSDVDPNGQALEQGVLLPWPSNPQASYLYFECQITCMLDSGIVVHNRLPQVNNSADTLGTSTLDNPGYANINTPGYSGVNLKSNDQYTDIVQRMGHSRYYFRLFGRAMRIGYQVPIPSLKKIGGVTAIPYDKIPQIAYNRLAPSGSVGGVPVWLAEWSLWYTTAVPPINNNFPVTDPTINVAGTAPVAPTAGIQPPLTQPDDNAVPAAPQQAQSAVSYTK